jgi:hypothetical protein
MDVGNGASPSLDEVHRYHLRRLNDALRRPGMWGGETTVRLFLDSARDYGLSSCARAARTRIAACEDAARWLW